MKRAFVLVLVVLCLLSVNTTAQIKTDSLFTKEQLISDLDSLKNTIIASHPAPFTFCGEEAFMKAYDNALSSIDSVVTLRDFSRIVARFINVLEDSHSTVDYGQLSEMVFSDKDDFIVPFAVYRKDNEANGLDYELLIVRDWEDVLPRGGRLLSINGMDVHELYDLSYEYACTEGSATSARNMVASGLLPYINGIFNPADSVNYFQVIPPGKEVAETYEVKGYQKKEYKELRTQRNKLDINKWINTTYDEEHSMAVLKLGTFSPPSSRKLKKHLKSTFKKVNEEGYKNLVVDLRGNGGGSSSWVEYFYAYFDSTGYNTPNNVISKNSELAMKRGKGITNPVVKAFVWLFYRHDEDIQSFKRFREMPIGSLDTVYFKDKVIHKKELVFNGNAYLMIDGMSASASVDFTNTFHRNKRGPIVGEPCLGPISGTWGNPARYTMPNSKLNVTISTIRYNYDNTFIYVQQAIQPDYWVKKTAEDLHSDRDTQLEFVKTLIKKK